MVLTIKELTSLPAGETVLSRNLAFPCCNNNIKLSNQSMFRLGLKLKHHITASELKHRLFPLENQETFFYCEDDGALAQVPQRGYGGSLLGDTQKPSGHCPGQLALSSPA